MIDLLEQAPECRIEQRDVTAANSTHESAIDAGEGVSLCPFLGKLGRTSQQVIELFTRHLDDRSLFVVGDVAEIVVDFRLLALFVVCQIQESGCKRPRRKPRRRNTSRFEPQQPGLAPRRSQEPHVALGPGDEPKERRLVGIDVKAVFPLDQLGVSRPGIDSPAGGARRSFVSTNKRNKMPLSLSNLGSDSVFDSPLLGRQP